MVMNGVWSVNMNGVWSVDVSASNYRLLRVLDCSGETWLLEKPKRLSYHQKLIIV